MKSAVRRGFVFATIAWAIALPLAALAAGRAHVSAIGSAFAIAVYGIGSVICHQLPERSFHLWSAQLPVCARCTGIYLGAAISIVPIVAARAFQASVAGRSAHGLALQRGALIVAALPSLATLVYEWTTGDTPSNPVRFAAGLPAGAVVSWLVQASATVPARERDSATRVMASARRGGAPRESDEVN